MATHGLPPIDLFENENIPKVLFCSIPYDAFFLDRHGNAWQKKSGLRRLNAALVRSYGGAIKPAERGFFSASARVIHVKG